MEETKYKQTEVGLIPEDWECSMVNDVCTFVNGYAFKSQDYKKTGTPIIRISDIGDNKVVLDDCVFYQGNIEEKFCITKGDLLIALSGATTGKMGVYLSEKKAYLNQRVGNLKVKNPHVLSHRYRNVFMQTFVEAISNRAFGAAQPNISGKTICDMFFPLPPLPEQHAIASALTSIDDLISSLDKQITKTQSVKQGVMQQLLTVLNTEDVTWKPLKEVCDFTRGKGLSKKDKGMGDIPIILYGELYTTYGNFINHIISRTSTNAIDNSPKIKKGDLLLPISSTTKEAQIGKVSAYCCDYDAYLGSDALLLRHSQISGYLVYILNSSLFEKEKMFCARGITINHLDPKELGEIEIPIPSIETQHRIASALTAIDDQISALEAKRKKYEMVKVGMMQQLLTGKIRLK